MLNDEPTPCSSLIDRGLFLARSALAMHAGRVFQQESASRQTVFGAYMQKALTSIAAIQYRFSETPFLQGFKESAYLSMHLTGVHHELQREAVSPSVPLLIR